jgi:hypothetical protein
VPPLCIDLCCGLGGWTKGFLAEGYEVIGFDIERYASYPGQLVLQDIRTLEGSRFRRAAVIVASPPCQEFSRHDQPWTRVKNPPYPHLGIELVEACKQLAHRAGVPLILENVRGAQKFIGSARNHFGSQYLWGDVPPLLPVGNIRNGFVWWGTEGDRTGKTVPARQKQQRSSSAQAERAEIPFDLARWIAQCFKPVQSSALAS